MEGLVGRKLLLQRIYSVNDPEPHRPPQVRRSGREVAVAVTKDTLWMVVLLSSLTLWAAVWAGAASVAWAWLQ
jgi:hypothetical protein